MNSVSYFLSDQDSFSGPIVPVFDAKRIMQNIDVANASLAWAKARAILTVPRCMIENNYPIRGMSQ